MSASSRVSPTNSERTSPLIYHANPSRLRIVRDQVSSWARLVFMWNPRLLIVVRRGCGWKKLSRVWFATFVSRPFIWLLNVLLRYQVDWFCLAEIYSYFIQPIGFFISAEFNILLLLEYLSPNQFSIPALNNREGLLLLVPAIIYLGYSRHLVQYWQTLLQRS